MFNAHDLITHIVENGTNPDDILTEALQSEEFVSQNYEFDYVEDDSQEQEQDHEEE